MRVCKMAVLTLVITTTLSCAGSSGIPLIGIDASGKALEKFVTNSDYKKFMKSSLVQLQDSVIPAVGNQIIKTKRSWHLRQVLVGIALKGSIGIAPLIKLDGKIGFRLVFTNKAG